MARSDFNEAASGRKDAASSETPLIAHSIAISVIVHPSYWMNILWGGACCLCLSLAILLAIPLQLSDTNLILRLLASTIALLAAIFSGKELLRQRTAFLLDITGAADIRLSVSSRTSTTTSLPDTPPPAETRFLAAGSFISPLLMVLRLADKHDNINTLLIFPDSVSQDAFRRLALACRWLAAHRKRRQPDISQ